MIFFKTERKKRRAASIPAGTSTSAGTRFAGAWLAIVVASLAMFGVSACGDSTVPASGDAVSRERHAGFSDAFPVSLGEKKLRLRLALTELEHRQGLSGCRGLDENSGMLFVYTEDAQRSFWMRGVPVDLSIGFFDAAGTLLEIYEMKANDLSLTPSRSAQVRFVLEMPAGWFSSNEILAGTRLNLAEVETAVRSRGFVYVAKSLSGRK